MKRHFYLLLSAALIAAATFLAGCETEEPSNGETPEEETVPGGGETRPDDVKYADFFQEVTAAQEDWSGEYLITYKSKDGQLTVMDAFKEKYMTGTDMTSELTAYGIGYEKGKVHSAKVSKDGTSYRIVVEGIGTLAFSGTKNTLNVMSSNYSSGADLWNISFTDHAEVTPVNDASRAINWNPGATRFACYASSSNQQPVTLYRKVTIKAPEGYEPGPDTPVTPDPEIPDPENPEVPDNPVPGPDVNKGGNSNGWLTNWELPHAEVKIEGNKAWSRSVNEIYGNAQAYVCETSDPNQLVVTHTFSNNGKVYRNYSLLFDKNRKASLWVAFAMHKSTWGGDAGRNDSWTDDPAIPGSWQSRGVGSPYSRGHQIASSDRQVCKGANQQTFYHSNQAPQWQTRFNDGVWNQLERAIQDRQPSGRDTLYVVTGPYYQDNKTLSDRDGLEVPRPSGFWKCIMKCSFDANGKMISANGIGYSFPKNGEYMNAQYNQYKKSIDEIEGLTGFDLYANLPEEFQKKAEANTNPLF